MERCPRGRRSTIGNRVYVISVPWVRIPFSPPNVKNTNPETKTGFVLFFSKEYFGIKVDLNGKKKNQPGG